MLVQVQSLRASGRLEEFAAARIRLALSRMTLEVLMLRILLVRHGQTEWNKGSEAGEHFRGRVDIGLNATGAAQAQSLAAYLATLKVKAVYASPLRRAVGTAQPIAQAHGLEAVPLQALLDIDYGQWGGRSHREVAAQWPDLYRLWLTMPHRVQIPGGESLAEVRQRVRAGLEEVLDRHTNELVVLVGHQVINKVVICAWLGLGNRSFWRVRQDTGCINRFDYDGEAFTLLTLNELCHLKSRPPDLDELPG
jgi:broad specificity phosphatase PhoE